MPNTIPIDKFWQKLLVASKSINKIPTEYLTVANNVRIYDWGLWARRGFEELTSSTLWTNNKWGFIMQGKLYQVANSKIYEVNKDSWVQTERATLPYNQRVDILVYKDFAIIVSNKQDLEVFNWTWLETTPTTVPDANTWIIEYTRGYSFLVWWSGLTFSIDQNQWPDDFYIWNDIAGSAYGQYLKQSITLSDAIDNPEVTLELYKEWSPTDNLNVAIYRTSDDALITNVWTVAWTSLTTSAVSTTVSLTWALPLTTAEAYYIKLSRSSSLDDTNYYALKWSETDVYTGWENSFYQDDIIIDYLSWEDPWSTTDFGTLSDSNRKVRQTFTIDATVTNPNLDFYLSKVNSPTADVKVWIYRTSDDVLITSEATIADTSIWSSITKLSVALTWSLTLTTSEAYYILFEKDWTFNNVNFYNVHTNVSNSGRPMYSGWELTRTQWTWTSWTTIFPYDRDVYFVMYETTAAYAVHWDIQFNLDALYTISWTTGSLYISRPITAANPEYAYDFTWAGSQNIVYDDTIVGLEWTMNWLYIFTEKKVEFLGANALQNVAWSATFISAPLWKSWEPVNNHCIASSWDKIFYVTKSLQIQTVNYIQGTASASVWTLSSRPVIWVKELIATVDDNQPNAFAIYNKKDETIQFHLRTKDSTINDITIIYDITNDTFSVDTNKYYNFVVEDWLDYYGLSDVDTSIYKDDIGYNDNWVAIPFEIQTQDMNLGTVLEKMFNWFFTAGWCWYLTTLTYTVYIDGTQVFTDTVTAWTDPGGDYVSTLTPFEKTADAGRIYRMWKRIKIKIESDSTTQDFILDILWTMATVTNYSDINNKF